MDCDVHDLEGLGPGKTKNNPKEFDVYRCVKCSKTFREAPKENPQPWKTIKCPTCGEERASKLTGTGSRIFCKSCGKWFDYLREKPTDATQNPQKYCCSNCGFRHSAAYVEKNNGICKECGGQIEVCRHTDKVHLDENPKENKKKD